MNDDLERVAREIAAPTLAIAESGNALTRFAEKRHGLLAGIVGTVGQLPMLRKVVRGFDPHADVEARRIYEGAVNADRDRATSDLAFVRDHLLPLSTSSRATIIGAARMFVDWVAAGRPHRDDMDRVRDAYDRYAVLAEVRKMDPARGAEAVQAYISTLEDALSPQSSE